MLAAAWAGLALLWAAGGGAGDAAGYRRRVSLEYNPGWASSAVNLLHSRAVGLNDTLHYVWSTIGAPTVLLVYTASDNSSLRVNWTQLLSSSPAGAIWVEPAESVLYSTAVVFPRLWEYNPTNTSNFSQIQTEHIYASYNLANFSWDSLEGQLNKTALSADFQGREGTFGNGSISFKMVQLISEPHNHSLGSSFLQWKMAAYSSETPTRENTVHCQYYPLQVVRNLGPEFRILHAYFGGDLERSCSLSALNISFGSEDNEAYREKKYLSWSALVGFGEPPREEFSPLVIGILAVALGTPVMLLIAGSLAVLTRKRKPCSEYKPIN